jgi:hypothetical protein
MPVAHADVDGQWMSRSRQPIDEAVRLAPGELGDWRDAAEQLVMMSDFFDSFGSDAPSFEDTLEKWPNVGGAAGPTERDD